MSRFTGAYALVVLPLNLDIINFYTKFGFKFNSEENILYMPVRNKQDDFLMLQHP